MSDEELRSVLADFIKECLNEISVKRASSGNEGENEIKVLILPPDFTRMYSGAGHITALLTAIFSNITEKLANFNTYFIFLRSFFVKYAQFLYLLILPAAAVQNLQNKHACFSFAGCAIPTADFSKS